MENKYKLGRIVGTPFEITKKEFEGINEIQIVLELIECFEEQIPYIIS